MRIGSRTGTKQRITFALHARGSRSDQEVSRHAAPAIRTWRARLARKRSESPMRRPERAAAQLDKTGYLDASRSRIRHCALHAWARTGTRLVPMGSL